MGCCKHLSEHHIDNAGLTMEKLSCNIYVAVVTGPSCMHKLAATVNAGVRVVCESNSLLGHRDSQCACASKC